MSEQYPGDLVRCMTCAKQFFIKGIEGKPLPHGSKPHPTKDGSDTCTGTFKRWPSLELFPIHMKDFHHE